MPTSTGVNGNLATSTPVLKWSLFYQIRKNEKQIRHQLHINTELKERLNVAKHLSRHIIIY